MQGSAQVNFQKGAAYGKTSRLTVSDGFSGGPLRKPAAANTAGSQPTPPVRSTLKTQTATYTLHPGQYFPPPGNAAGSPPNAHPALRFLVRASSATNKQFAPSTCRHVEVGPERRPWVHSDGRPLSDIGSDSKRTTGGLIGGKPGRSRRSPPASVRGRWGGVEIVASWHGLGPRGTAKVTNGTVVAFGLFIDVEQGLLGASSGGGAGNFRWVSR